MLQEHDQKRQQVLDYFFERARNARSMTGKFGLAVKVSQLKADLKDLYGLSQAEVITNLHYLIDRDWVEEIQETKQVPTKSGILIPSATKYYRLTAEALDKMQGGSVFRRESPFAGINIQATSGNVITVGNDNYVQAGREDLYKKLSELRAGIIDSSLGVDEKLAAVVDITALQDQLVKPAPDRTVMSRLWETAEKAATVAGLVQLATTIHKGLTALGIS
jgi:hypothetical protein